MCETWGSGRNEVLGLRGKCALGANSAAADSGVAGAIYCKYALK